MTDLQHRQQKIQEKRKQTSWRDFVKEICSWKPLVLSHVWWTISRFPDTHRVNPIPFDDFAKQRDKLTEYSIDLVDENFFSLFGALLKVCPIPWLLSFYDNDNCNYADIAIGSKNCYLSYAVVNCENVFYSESVKDGSRNVYNSLMVLDGSENIYACSSVFRSFNIFFSHFVTDSSFIRASRNMQWCIECICCHDLEHASYCIENVAYTPEEYLEFKNKYLQKLTLKQPGSPSREAEVFARACEQVSGNYLVESHDIDTGYFVFRTEYARNVVLGGSVDGNTHLYDVFGCGAPRADYFYAVMWGWSFAEQVYCSSHINGGSHVFYSYFLESCSYCLGCVWLQNKSFCILNKQYTKEERHEKVNEIFERMEKEGTLGDFFPWSMSPFYFNDTAAYLIDDSFTKEEVEAEGYLWRDEEVRVDIPEGVEIVKVSQLGEYEGWRDSPLAPLKEGGSASWWIDPEILNRVIQDEQGNVYRIVKMEYDFLIKHGLPLPRLHWLDRLKQNFRIN